MAQLLAMVALMMSTESCALMMSRQAGGSQLQLHLKTGRGLSAPLQQCVTDEGKWV
jgi:hypothetical protein